MIFIIYLKNNDRVTKRNMATYYHMGMKKKNKFEKYGKMDLSKLEVI